MASRLLHSLRRAQLTSILHLSSPTSHYFRTISYQSQSVILQSKAFIPWNQWNSKWESRNFSHGLVNLVISEGKPKFETHETEPPKKEKWKTKKRLKMQRKREKQKRKSANKRDPRCLGVKGQKKKHKFPSAEERIKYKIKNARIKEALLIERLRRYEVRKLQGPVVEPVTLTGEERFYMKKMAQKRSNYVPVGRRGVFGGVILNMHMHWKKHETVKVICKPCKPGQVHEYVEEISRLSGGIPIQVIGNDSIIFYRGKDYVQPEVMSPIDTLSKKKALEKSKYEQSLESVRRFISIAEKELELYYRHVALYGDPNDRSSYSAYTSATKSFTKPGIYDLSDEEFSTTDRQHELQSDEESDESGTESDLDYGSLSDSNLDSDDEEGTSNLHESSTSVRSSSSVGGGRISSDNQYLLGDINSNENLRF